MIPLRQLDEAAVMPLALYEEAEHIRQVAVIRGEEFYGDTPAIRAQRLHAHRGLDAPTTVLDPTATAGVHRAIHTVDGDR